jgi:DNA-directed RNA polymerase specialized sigma24 family protein
VLRFCVARLGTDRGEEAFQETLLAALCHYDELRNAGAMGTTADAARRNVFEGLKRLRRDLADDPDNL